MTHLVHRVWFHAWHWLFQMVQLSNWFGNIVAGVVVFLAASLLWPRVRRAVGRYVEGHVKSLHDKLDRHHEALLAQAEEHHEQHLELVRAHHAVVLSTIKSPPVDKPAPVKAQPVKKTVAKKSPTKKAGA